MQDITGEISQKRIKNSEHRIDLLRLSSLLKEIRHLGNVKFSVSSAAPVEDSENTEPSEKILESSIGNLDVFVDGACYNNGKSDAKMAVGVWFGPDHEWNIGQLLSGLVC